MLQEGLASTDTWTHRRQHDAGLLLKFSFRRFLEGLSISDPSTGRDPILQMVWIGRVSGLLFALLHHENLVLRAHNNDSGSSTGPHGYGDHPRSATRSSTDPSAVITYTSPALSTPNDTTCPALPTWPVQSRGWSTEPSMGKLRRYWPQ